MSVSLYKRYVDDINMYVKSATPGSRIVNGIVQVDEEAAIDDMELEKDEMTFKIVSLIGESIHESIKLEYDVPSKHIDSKIPILDTKIWIERKSDDEYNIMHEYYTKEVASPLLISMRAANPWKQKRTILTQFCLRIMLNCSPSLPWGRVTEHLERASHRMQASGYERKTRYEVIRSAICAYQGIVREHETGRQPMYRKSEDKRIERRESKRLKRKIGTKERTMKQ